MPDRDDVSWFKDEFHGEIAAATAGTPFTVDMLAAIACQETGEIWPILRRKGLPTERILALCVGDTLDSDKGRRAFPKTKADLVAAPDGQRMFDIAHQALVDMAAHIAAYRKIAQRPNKFCHGFGIFQLDLQFFRDDPEYFLQQRYAVFAECLRKCLDELRHALVRARLADRPALDDMEMAAVAIAYNTGSFNPRKGLQQGFFNGEKFYGELFFDFLRLAHTAGDTPAIAVPQPGTAALPDPTPVTAEGAFFRVETKQSTLRLRSAPAISTPPTANVIGELPDGHLVRAVGDKATKGFLEVETSLAGAHLQGFAAQKFLKAAPEATEIPVVVPETVLPSTGLVAVYMPRKPGTVTRRSEIAGPHSLNEAGQPGRAGTTPDELRGELADIIDWLAVDKAAHKRYQPRDNSTFCNIYAHDYCFLAGVYLPRVWWTPRAIEALAQGHDVQPLYGDTITEMRANDLFRWLRDFGDRFGWRQTGTLTKLQTEADMGAIGLIVARRKEDGRSGHIVAVVPETGAAQAVRDATGAVIAPLQSQAGTVNFRYGTGKRDWWKGEQFAESAFWLHA